MEKHQRRRQDLVQGGTKRGVDCEDRDHWRTYGKTIQSWPLNFFHILERNLNGHFTKIHSISKFNLPFSRIKLKKLCYCQVTTQHNLLFLFAWLQNLTLRFRKIHQLPTPSLDPCWGFVRGPTGTSVLTLKALRSGKTGTVYRTRSS